MTHQEQTNLWISGESVHDTEHDTCCPDFSCCQPHLKADDQTRQAFGRADGSGRHQMLMTFLVKLINDRAPGKEVYIAGDEANYTPKQ